MFKSNHNFYTIINFDFDFTVLFIRVWIVRSKIEIPNYFHNSYGMDSNLEFQVTKDSDTEESKWRIS
jgi:hypothetical protein